MRAHNTAYLVKEGVKNIFFNKLMSFACIGVLVACLLLIGTAVLASMVVGNMVGQLESENEIVVFLEEGLHDVDVASLDIVLTNMDNVAQVRFVSRDETLEKNMLDMPDLILDDLRDDNPLADTYEVRLADLELLDETVEAILKLDGVEKVNTATDVVNVLIGLRKAVTYAGAGVVLILVVVSIVIITNTIKLTVFSRRREINIMKYVGATDGFIRLPFIVEGMLIGLIAAIFSFVILGLGYTYLLEWAGENYGGYIGILINNAVTFQDIALYMFGSFATLGVFIGVVSSGIFVRRYLKV